MESHPKVQTRIHVAFAAVGAFALLTLIFGMPTYLRYMRERRQLGMQYAVRADLEMLVERETDFFKRNGFFTTDLAALNLDLPKPLALLYKFGFTRAMEKSPAKAISLAGKEVELDPSRMDLDRLLKSRPELEVTLSPTTKLGSIEFSKLTSYCVDCTATRTSFKIIAAANLDDDPVLDVWTVDEKGVIQHAVDDLDQR